MFLGVFPYTLNRKPNTRGYILIANFEYNDGSGEFFISIDTDRCSGCGDCVCLVWEFVIGILNLAFDTILRTPNYLP